MAGTKIPQSVLVLVHTQDLEVLLLKRADSAGFWQSVTGSRDSLDEPLAQTAERELLEETGIRLDMPGVGPLCDWNFQQTYEIFAHWRHRYPDGVTHNVEHVFSVCVPKAIAITLADREHTEFCWKPWQQAAEMCFSWSNVAVIRELPRRCGRIKRLRLATYNIHKGQRRSLPAFRKKLKIHGIASVIEEFKADILCLQEVQGRNDRGLVRFEDWPVHGQHHFLTPQGYHLAYAGAAHYLHGHHGNALISRFPILYSETRDFSDHVLEKRATLHAQLDVMGVSVHVFVVHFGLFASSRRRQVSALAQWIAQSVPEGAPLIIAGDFNDWRLKLGNWLTEELGVSDVTRANRRLPIRTYPAFMPLMHMDRIFQRGFTVRSVGAAQNVATGLLSLRGWSKLSDHMPVIADLELSGG